MIPRFFTVLFRLLAGFSCVVGPLPAGAANPSFTVVVGSSVVSDPVNHATNPKAIPGAVVCFFAVTTNSGAGASDVDSFVFTNAIPAAMALCVTDFGGPGSGPVSFSDGAPASELSYDFRGLGSSEDGVSFSSDGGATWVYTPLPDGNGCDANVTNIRVALRGAFAAAGEGNPHCMIQFRCRVK